MTEHIYIGKFQAEYESVFSESDEEILNKIKKKTTGSIFEPVTVIEKTAKDNLNDLSNRWVARNTIKPNKTSLDVLANLPITHPILVCYLTNEYQPLINNFQNVFILNNIENYLLDTEYNTFIDINRQDYIKKTPSSKTYIYMNQFTNKWKQAQKMWTEGDLRSFNHIDPEVYKNHKNISLIGACFLYLKKLYPDEKIVIVGNNIEENCAMTQILWKQYSSQLIFV